MGTSLEGVKSQEDRSDPSVNFHLLSLVSISQIVEQGGTVELVDVYHIITAFLSHGGVIQSVDDALFESRFFEIGRHAIRLSELFRSESKRDIFTINFLECSLYRGKLSLKIQILTT
jgi:hypothetical protein